MDIKIDGRGGARKNAGRKPKSATQKRKQLSTTVDDDADKKLRAIAEREKISIGKVIDAWAKSQP